MLVDPHIIYLDQNAVSYLSSAENASWATLRHVLIEAFEAERLVCPMPFETLVESAPCHAELRRKIAGFFEAAGGCIAWRLFKDILADATMNLVRPSHTIQVFCRIKSSWADRDPSAVENAHRQARENMTARVLAYKRASGAETMELDEIQKSSVEERCGYLYRDLGRYIKDHTCSNYERSWLMRKLVGWGLTGKEADDLREGIRLRKWEQIPENFFDALLGSRWEHDRIHRHRPNYHANDEFDRWRAAVALPNADAFVSDNYTADLCRRAGSSRYKCAEVFSVREIDRLMCRVMNLAAN
jgi:hypothetical protein